MAVGDRMLTCPHCRSGEVVRRGKSESGEDAQRIQCQNIPACGRYSTVSLTEFESDLFTLEPARRQRVLEADRYIITSAQNNTALHPDFWKSIKRYAQRVGAQILVIPVRYRNPTSQMESDKEEVWWPDEVLPYLTDEEIHIHKDLWVMGNVKVQATAVNPLTGLEPLSKSSSAIFGHAQVSRKLIATPQNALPKIHQTTGSTSRKNYSRSKAGIKGAFHHSLGAVIVERDGKIFHLRNVCGDSKGEFYDLDLHATPKGVKKIRSIPAIVTGDEHALFADPQVKEATYLAKDSIVNTLRPKKVVRHDVHDCYSVSHHHRKNFVVQFVKYKTGMNSALGELHVTKDHINETTPTFAENVFVASNHHEHLYRWLLETDPRTEPWNIRLWCELTIAVTDAAEMTSHGMETIDPFAHWTQPQLDKPAVWLKRDDSYLIEGIECALHGDEGANGSRGSAVGLSKLGVRVIGGHSHSDEIEKGFYRVGTSSMLKLEYNRRGPSSTIHTHCLIHPNGKRQLVSLIEGAWRLR